MKTDEIFHFINATNYFTDEKSIILRLSPAWKAILWFWLSGSVIVGWIAKYYIFKHIFRTKIKEQPINVLLFIEQFINCICGTFILLNLSMSLLTGTSIQGMIDSLQVQLVSSNTYCWTFYHVVSIGFIYQAIDGIGISIIRLLYIKCGTWVRYKIGEFKLLFVVELCIALLASVIVCLYSIENISNRSVYNICMGYSEKYQSILLDYIQAGSRTQFKTERTFWIPVVGFLGVGLGLTELFSYSYIFYYLYKHNEAMKLLPEEAKKSRNQFNAQTMLGQFYFYLTDNAYVLFLLVAFQSSSSTVAPDAKDITSLLKTSEFGFMSVVQCMLIPTLRKRLMLKVQDTFVVVKRKFE